MTLTATITTPVPLAFTAAEHVVLSELQTALTKRTRQPIELTVEANEDGEQWALFNLEDATPLVSVQALRAGSAQDRSAWHVRHFALVGPDGCAVPFAAAPVRQLRSLEAAAVRAGVCAFQRLGSPRRRRTFTEPEAPQPLRFTEAERRLLSKLRSDVAKNLSRQVRVEVDATETGDEYATVMLDDEAPEGFAVLATIMTTRETGQRAFALLAADGHIAPRTVPLGNLAQLLPQARRAAAVEFWH